MELLKATFLRPASKIGTFLAPQLCIQPNDPALIKFTSNPKTEIPRPVYAQSSMPNFTGDDHAAKGPPISSIHTFYLAGNHNIDIFHS